MEQKYVIALIMTFMAGMATVLGGCLTFFVKRDNLKALSIGLGFSAGVMIFISLNELLPDAQRSLTHYFAQSANMIAFAMFFVGIGIAMLIDYFVPDHIEEDILTPHDECCNSSHKIKQAGIVTAIAIAIHNFPEGIATFVVSSESIRLGLPIVIAIAIHNIPEGIAVALPIYHATGKKRQAILYSFLSGISEPAGALIGFLVLRNYMTETTLGIAFAIVAGIMVYISLDTLLPLAREYGENHHVVGGIIAGMFVICLSLLLF